MSNEAVTVAKKRRDDDNTRTLASGVRVRIVPVPQAIIQDALILLKEPHPPTFYNEATEREEENPLHPDYLEARDHYQRELARITFDVFALFGVELMDGLPEDSGWLGKLKMAVRLGRLDLSKFDLDDPVDQEFLFKRYIAMSDDEYLMIGRSSGINAEEVQAAADSFPGDEARGEDS